MSMSEEKSLIDLLREDYRREKVSILGRDVYVLPLNLADSANVHAKFPDDTAKRHAEMLIMACRTESGAPSFTAADRDFLASGVNSHRLEAALKAAYGRSVDEQAEK